MFAKNHYFLLLFFVSQFFCGCVLHEIHKCKIYNASNFSLLSIKNVSDETPLMILSSVSSFLQQDFLMKNKFIYR